MPGGLQNASVTWQLSLKLKRNIFFKMVAEEFASFLAGCGSPGIKHINSAQGTRNPTGKDARGGICDDDEGLRSGRGCKARPFFLPAAFNFVVEEKAR